MTLRTYFGEHRENYKENAYNLLYHGDFNIINAMFKKDIFDGGVADCMLLDF